MLKAAYLSDNNTTPEVEPTALPAIYMVTTQRTPLGPYYAATWYRVTIAAKKKILRVNESSTNSSKTRHHRLHTYCRLFHRVHTNYLVLPTYDESGSGVRRSPMHDRRLGAIAREQNIK